MRILIADDHPVIVEALSQIIKAQYPNARIFSLDFSKPILETIIKKNIEFLILDIQLVDGNALKVLEDLRLKRLVLPIMVFTTTQIKNSFVQYNNGQVWGFVNKNINNSDLKKVIANFLTQKEIYNISSKHLLKANKKENHENTPLFGLLSKNEFVVMEMLANNTSVKEIASITSRKPTTIATYKRRIFEKMGIKNLMELLDLLRSYGKFS